MCTIGSVSEKDQDRSKSCGKGSRRSKCCYKGSRRSKHCCKGLRRSKCCYKGSRILKCCCKGLRRSKCCYEGSEDRSVAAKGSSDRVLQKMKTLKSNCSSYDECWKLPMTYRCITSILLKILSLVTPIADDDVVSRIPFSLRGSVKIL